jgi:hypothetical protein
MTRTRNGHAWLPENGGRRLEALEPAGDRFTTSDAATGNVRLLTNQYRSPVHAVIRGERGMSDRDVPEKGWNHDNHARPFGSGVFLFVEKEEKA